jgi:hypothetical protein
MKFYELPNEQSLALDYKAGIVASGCSPKNNQQLSCVTSGARSGTWPRKQTKDKS